MPPIKLYFMAESPPCRAVQMVASILNVPLELVSLDLSKGEHLAESFVKINPSHVVPTIEDGSFVLWESRAIMCYLANTYGSESNLYPSNPVDRAKVDQMLYFDIGSLYMKMGNYLRPLIKGEPLQEENEAEYITKLDQLESILTSSPFVFGDHLTLADISIEASLSFSQASSYDLKGRHHIVKWLDRVKSLIPDYHAINHEPMIRLKGYIEMKRSIKSDA